MEIHGPPSDSGQSPGSSDGRSIFGATPDLERQHLGLFGAHCFRVPDLEIDQRASRGAPSNRFLALTLKSYDPITEVRYRHANQD